MNFWFILPNDVSRPIGGVKQIHRLCESIASLGFSASIVQESDQFSPGWFDSNVSKISFKSFLGLTTLKKNTDYLILPETMIGYVSKLMPGLPKIIFNQNVSYTFGLNKKGDGFSSEPRDILQLYDHSDVVAIWCVSKYDYSSLVHGFSFSSSKVFRIVNPIETSLFKPRYPKRLQISYMPRKNSLHSRRVRALIDRQNLTLDWSIVPIKNMSLSQVSNTLRDSMIFFSFGHPEGFGLPLAESLACGCALVGYHGLGGKELFDLANSFGVGFPVDFGDLPGFIKSLQSVEKKLLHTKEEFLKSLLQSSYIVRSHYNLEHAKLSVSAAIDSL